MNYLLNSTNVYRVPSEAAALKLREELSNLDYGELVQFAYSIKEVKQKGEVVDTYYVVKAKIAFTPEKEPELVIYPNYGLEKAEV